MGSTSSFSVDAVSERSWSSSQQYRNSTDTTECSIDGIVHSAATNRYKLPPCASACRSECLSRNLIRTEICLTPCGSEWTYSNPRARIIGVLMFLVAISAIAVGFALSFGCPSCYGEQGPQVDFPDQFALSDTLKHSPSRWTGLGLFSLTAILTVALGWYRHIQIRTLCDHAFPVLFRPNCVSAFFGISSCLLFMAVIAIPSLNDSPILAFVRLGLLLLAVTALVMYALIQCAWIERVLIREEIIRRTSHRIRFVALLMGALLAAAAFPLLLIRKDMTTETTDNFHQSLAVGALLLAFECGSLLHCLAAIGLTDFASMSVNQSKLESLAKTTYLASASIVCGTAGN